MTKRTPAEVFRSHRSQHYAELVESCADRLPGDLTGVLIALHVVRAAAMTGRATDPWHATAEEFRIDLERLDEEITAAQGRGLVQFTDPQRMSDVLPGLLLIARRYPGLPMRLVELGAAAGLLLVPEVYDISYPRGAWLPEGASAQLVSDLDVPPELLRTPLRIEARLGLDLAPVGPAAPGTFDYLRSFCWAGDPAREARLASAVSAVADWRPRIEVSDVLVDLGDVLAEQVTRDAVTVVVESGLTAYLSDSAVLRLGQVIHRAASRGPVVLLTRGTEERGAEDLPNSVRVVDMHRPWRYAFAACDLLSERARWLDPRAGARLV